MKSIDRFTHTNDKKRESKEEERERDRERGKLEISPSAAFSNLSKGRKERKKIRTEEGIKRREERKQTGQACILTGPQ